MDKIKRIKDLYLMRDFCITLTFHTGEVRILDLKPIMEEYPLFHALEENRLFENAKIDLGGFGIVWNEEFSISSGDAYERSKVIEDHGKSILNTILIKNMVNIRKDEGITQKELSDISGIPQPTIAKIEKESADPRLSTITNIIDSLGYKLAIVPKEHNKRN